MAAEPTPEALSTTIFLCTALGAIAFFAAVSFFVLR